MNLITILVFQLNAIKNYKNQR